MGKPQVTLYVDIVSPFGYLAFYALENFTVFKQCDVTYVPVFLGGIMNMANNRPPLVIKNKGQWVNKSRLRFARDFKIPMAEDMPPTFPINTLTTQRTLCAIAASNPSVLNAAISALYSAFFIDHKSVHEPETIVSVLAPVVGGEAEAKKFIEQAGSAEAKKKLTQNTEAAFNQGAFGLPYFVATNAKGEKEGFWGMDHLGFLVEHLGLERPGDLKGWRSLL